MEYHVRVVANSDLASVAEFPEPPVLILFVSTVAVAIHDWIRECLVRVVDASVDCLYPARPDP